jgi:hypothetical protein
MIGEKFLASLIGIDPDWDSDEHQESWERQKYIDDNDLDDDDDLLDDDDDSDRKAWWQVW